MFADLGATVIDTDVIAREVVMPGEPALEEIRERFGNRIVGDDGTLDRRKLRRIVFADDTARQELESILHPRIQAEVLRQSRDAGGPYQIIVVPLLVGSPLLGFLDRVLVVDCDEETQIQRLMARDAETSQQARQILAAQSSRQARLDIADDLIGTDESLTSTEQRVTDLDREYRRLSAS